MVAIGSMHGWHPTQMRGRSIDLHRGRPVTSRRPRSLTTPSLHPHLHPRRMSPRAARKSDPRQSRENFYRDGIATETIKYQLHRVRHRTTTMIAVTPQSRQERVRRSRGQRRWQKRRRLRKWRRLRERRQLRPQRRMLPLQSHRKRKRRRFLISRLPSIVLRRAPSHRK